MIALVRAIFVLPNRVFLTLTLLGGFDTIPSELSPLVGFSFDPTL